MNDIIYIIGQAMGVVAIALGFLSYQTKTQRRLLILQTATTVVFCLHYLMIGATSGMALNVVGIFRNLFYCYRDKTGKRDLFIPIVFAVIMGGIGIAAWEAWYSVFVILGLVINTLCLALPDPQKVRASILVTSPMVLIYDGFAASYGGMVYESVAIISSVIGLVRMRRRDKKALPDAKIKQ